MQPCSLAEVGAAEPEPLEPLEAAETDFESESPTDETEEDRHTPLWRAVREWHEAMPPESLLELRQTLMAVSSAPFKIGTACSGSDVLLVLFRELADFWSEVLGVPFTFRHCFACEKQPLVQEFLLQHFSDLEVLVPDLSFMGDHSVPSIGRDGKTEGVELPKVHFFAAGFVCKSRSKLNAQASAHRGCVQKGTELTGESFAATCAYIKGYRPQWPVSQRWKFDEHAADSAELPRDFWLAIHIAAMRNLRNGPLRHRPWIVLLENVASLNEKVPETGVSDADWIVDWFAREGYECTMVKCDARTYGSLPRRERLYWIAVDGGNKVQLGKVSEVLNSAHA